MIQTGVLTEDDPVELLEGVLFHKMPKSPPHRIALAKLHRALQSLPLTGWSIQLQEPVTLSDGEPEPDLAVIRGVPEDCVNAHAGPESVALVIEVADSTLERDRGIKLRSYARAAIPIYWIINLPEQCVEIHSSPEPGNAIPNYRDTRIASPEDSVQVMIAGKVPGSIRVAELLP